MPEPPAIGEAMTSSTRQSGWPAIQSRTSVHGPLPRRRIAHDAALSHGRPARLELRLDQRHQPGSGPRERQRHRQRLGQRDEAHVGDEGADRLRHERAIEPARVAILERDDPGVGGKARVQLVVAHVDGIDARRAAVEQHLGEAAGRRADVEGNDAVNGKAEMVERGDQLRGSARDVSVRRARQADGGIGGDAGARAASRPRRRSRPARGE